MAIKHKLALLILISPMSAMAADWFSIHPQYGFCYPENLPVVLESLDLSGVKYDTKDVVEDGEVVVVTVSVNTGVKQVFYRGKKRCESAAKKEQGTRAQKYNKYK